MEVKINSKFEIGQIVILMEFDVENKAITLKECRVTDIKFSLHLSTAQSRENRLVVYSVEFNDGDYADTPERDLYQDLTEAGAAIQTLYGGILSFKNQ